jgi:hypothetical protein
MAKVTPNLARWNWEQASSATGTLFWGTDSIPLHVQQPLMPIMYAILDFLLDAN